VFASVENSTTAAPDDDRAIDSVILTCPRCGHVDRMLAASYALWSEGILCGLCGPPYVKMHVQVVQSAARR
jgi:hypothetical protein